MFESFKWVNNAGQVCIFFALLGEKKKKYAFYMALKICNGKCGVNIYQLKKLTISLGCLFFYNPYNQNPKQHRHYLPLT